MIDVAPTLRQLLHDRQELLLHGTAEAAVGELVEGALTLALLAAEITALENLPVDAERAEFVDDDGDAPPVIAGQQTPQQRGFTAAEKASDDGRRNLLQPRTGRRYGTRCGQYGTCHQSLRTDV